MRRGRTLILIGFAAFLFLGFSALLARALTGAGDERAQVLDVLEAQAPATRPACSPSCPAAAPQPACAEVTRTRVAELERPGRVEILNYQPSVQVALTRRTGVGRVAWRAGGSPPVVQCVRVRRDGPLTGADVELLVDLGPDRQRGELRLRCPRCGSPWDSLLLALLAPAAAQAADKPTAETLYADGPEGRYLMGGDWLFRLDAADRGVQRRYHRQTGTAGWSTVKVPHAWNVGDHSVASMNGSVGWYRKDFELPDASAALDWAVRFESVNYRARVWLNGREVGSHAGAYLPFTVPLDRLKRAASTGSWCASTPAARRPTSRPAASARARGCPPAAGGTTAASCARSTSRGSTRWRSSRRS